MIPWKPYIPHALGGLAAVCLVGFGVQWWQSRSVERALAEAEASAHAAQLHADSVDTENAERQIRIDSLLQSAAASDSAATSWRRRAQSTEAVLAQLATTGKRLRDSLQLAHTAAESLIVLPRLVANLSHENLNLRSSLTDALAADSMRKLAVDSLKEVHVGDSTKYELVVVSDKKLRAALEKAQQVLARAEAPCRILFWSCPSRTAVAALGAGIGAGVTYAMIKR